MTFRCCLEEQSLSSPSEPINRQIIYGNENSLFPVYLLPQLDSRAPTRPPSLLEHLIQGLKTKTNVVSMQIRALCASLNHVKVQLPNSVYSPALVVSNAGEL